MSAAVANKFRSNRDLEVVRKYAASHNIEILAEVPYDDEIQSADLAGSAPDLGERNAAAAAIEKVAVALGL